MDAYEQTMVRFRNNRIVSVVRVENRSKTHDESRTDEPEVRNVNLQRHTNAVQRLALIMGKFHSTYRHSKSS